MSPEIEKKWDDRIALMLERADRLNEWEVGFIDSLEIRRSEGRELTFLQSSKLNQIFNKVGG